MFLASQLTEFSSRFPAHVEDLRQFLLKEKLPVPSPDVIPELASRLASDARFRADVGSLLRAILYRERERVGPEELLGMLVAAAAGTKQDLKSESQEASIRDMLRYVLQSRRATFRVDPDEESAAEEPETPEPVQVGAVQVEQKPLLVRGSEAGAQSKKLELKADELPVAVAETKSREADDRESSDVVLPPLRSTGLFAAQTEVEPSWWRAHPALIAGLVSMLVGTGLGLTLHRVVSAAETHVAFRAANSSVSKPQPDAPVTTSGTAAGSKALAAGGGPSLAPQPVDRERQAKADGSGITEAPVGTVQTASATDNSERAAQPAAPMEGRATPPPAIAAPAASSGKSSAVPVTVVKQVVTASASGSDGEAAGGTQLSAATRSVVHPGSAGMTAANVIFSPAPAYPPAAAAAGVHGQVTVHAVVDPDGNVIYARAVSGPPLLRDAAQEAVQKWRYRPLLDNGKPLAVTTVAIVDFKVAR